MIEIRTKIISILLVISVALNIVMLYIVEMKNAVNNQVLEQVTFNGIQSNLVQLEGSIKYQIENDWANEYHVTEKLDDVIDGIGLAFEVAQRTGQLKDGVEAALWQLYNFLLKYKQDSGFPNIELTKTEREEFIKLGKKLLIAGWGMNLGYHSDMKSFIDKVQKLLE